MASSVTLDSLPAADTAAYTPLEIHLRLTPARAVKLKRIAAAFAAEEVALSGVTVSTPQAAIEYMIDLAAAAG